MKDPLKKIELFAYFGKQRKIEALKINKVRYGDVIINITSEK